MIVIVIKIVIIIVIKIKIMIVIVIKVMIVIVIKIMVVIVTGHQERGTPIRIRPGDNLAQVWRVVDHLPIVVPEYLYCPTSVFVFCYLSIRNIAHILHIANTTIHISLWPLDPSARIRPE